VTSQRRSDSNSGARIPNSSSRGGGKGLHFWHRRPSKVDKSSGKNKTEDPRWFGETRGEEASRRAHDRPAGASEQRPRLTVSRPFLQSHRFRAWEILPAVSFPVRPWQSTGEERGREGLPSGSGPISGSRTAKFGIFSLRKPWDSSSILFDLCRQTLLVAVLIESRVRLVDSRSAVSPPRLSSCVRWTERADVGESPEG